MLWLTVCPLGASYPREGENVGAIHGVYLWGLQGANQALDNLWAICYKEDKEPLMNIEVIEDLVLTGKVKAALLAILDVLEELENRTESLAPRGEYFDDNGNLRDSD